MLHKTKTIETVGTIEAIGDTFAISFLLGKWHVIAFALRCEDGSVLEFYSEGKKNARYALLSQGLRVKVKYSLDRKGSRNLQGLQILWPSVTVESKEPQTDPPSEV